MGFQYYNNVMQWYIKDNCYFEDPDAHQLHRSPFLKQSLADSPWESQYKYGFLRDPPVNVHSKNQQTNAQGMN